MSLYRHNPAELAPPTGSSHAVTATGTRLVFLAGQAAHGPDGKIVGDSLTEQFATALGNLLTVLRHAGGTPADLARLTVYTTDVDTYQDEADELGEIWARLAGRDHPATAVIGVVRLRDDRARIELDGIAVLDEPTPA
ncbi:MULTISPECIES: RidA family protein [unclassified Streptomyces]|uniref:RidA family protein n=1 Tax=unclassified Streptomyces TaxID=2593676 RepID=UPI00166133F9|nr:MULTISPECIES: RidA family protein [unclassified Streptomyces]MBD0709613.1 enamine deaminase RidA [Streptomyces sp. CBMA291]MBD0714361.1 enamine deaminase RidA [Streptomyces sp. CBMA370]